MKTVTISNKNAAQLLLDSGLLGEINRVVLHPRGLALSVEVEGDKVIGFAGLLDYRDDPTGISFTDELKAEISEKLAAYDSKHMPVFQIK